jgi:hypothetical protein
LIGKIPGRLLTLYFQVHHTSWHKKPGPGEINSSTVIIISSIEQELRQVRSAFSPEQANNGKKIQTPLNDSFHGYIIPI